MAFSWIKSPPRGIFGTKPSNLMKSQQMLILPGANGCFDQFTLLHRKYNQEPQRYCISVLHNSTRAKTSKFSRTQNGRKLIILQSNLHNKRKPRSARKESQIMRFQGLRKERTGIVFKLIQKQITKRLLKDKPLVQ